MNIPFHASDVDDFARSIHFDRIMRFRCPPVLPAAVKQAADKRMISTSSYVRQAIAERLRRDGVNLSSHEAA
jgi:hypothetical protein